MAKYINVEVDTVIITKDVNDSSFQYTGDIDSIGICNTGTGEIEVSLALNAYESGVDLSYIIKEVGIPVGVTLLLDHDISFDVNTYALDFYIVGTTPKATIIIK